MAAIIVSSAFLRLTSMGIGCEPWPECYGRIEVQDTSRSTASIGKSASSVTMTRLLHRVAAMLVAILAILVLLLSLVRGVRSRTNLALALSALALTAMLAIVGRISTTLLVPAVGVTNLLGGFGLLACFWMLRLNNLPNSPVANTGAARSRTVAIVGLVIFVLQAATGALISVTYSAALCPSLWICDDAGVETADQGTRFEPFAPLPMDATGKVAPANAMADVQAAHRVSGAITAALIAALGAWLAMCCAQPALGAGLLVLGLSEAAIGVMMATHDFPLAAAMAHNFVAAALLLFLVTLLWRSYTR
jgi:cytochrome c oxidase assembly protein subunit 15